MMVSQAYDAGARKEAYAALSLAFNQQAGLTYGRELPRFLGTYLERYASVRDCRFLFAPLTKDFPLLPDQPGFEQELSDDFNRLFYGPGRLVAPPYESVYVSADRTVIGQAALDVLDYYSRNGVSIRETFRDCPDHVAVELEFMAHLCAKEEHAWETGNIGEAVTLRAVQKSFLAKHLMRWIPQFCSRASTGAHTRFFRMVAILLLSFIECEAAEAAGVERLEFVRWKGNGRDRND